MKLLQIDIIVPFYNCEKYLEKCVESILNQTYKNIKIILVNDGSTDGSEKITTKYINNNPTITLINNDQNVGPGYARNAGMQHAKGHFIAFVDADDTLEKEWLGNMLKSATEATEIVLGNQKKELKKSVPKIASNYYKGGISMSSTNKLYNLDFLKTNKIDFHPSAYMEDRLFVLKILSHAKKIESCTYNGYFVIKREDSIMHRIVEKHYTDLITISLAECNQLIASNMTFVYFDLFIANLKVLRHCLRHDKRFMEKNLLIKKIINVDQILELDPGKTYLFYLMLYKSVLMFSLGTSNRLITHFSLSFLIRLAKFI